MIYLRYITWHATLCPTVRVLDPALEAGARRSRRGDETSSPHELRRTTVVAGARTHRCDRAGGQPGATGQPPPVGTVNLPAARPLHRAVILRCLGAAVHRDQRQPDTG